MYLIVKYFNNGEEYSQYEEDYEILGLVDCLEHAVNYLANIKEVEIREFEFDLDDDSIGALGLPMVKQYGFEYIDDKDDENAFYRNHFYEFYILEINCMEPVELMNEE